MKAPFYFLLFSAAMLFSIIAPATAAPVGLRFAHALEETPGKRAAREKAATATKTATIKSASAPANANSLSRMRSSVRKSVRRMNKKDVTTPEERSQKLHHLQLQLQSRARHEARAHRLRCARQMNS